MTWPDANRSVRNRACRPGLVVGYRWENQSMSMPKEHDPLCPFLERRATCQCALIRAVEDRMFKEWGDADAYQSSLPRP